MDEEIGAYMLLTDAAQALGVQPATLRQQVRAGKLRAIKRGRDWWTTQEWLDEYREHHPARSKRTT